MCGNNFEERNKIFTSQDNSGSIEPQEVSNPTSCSLPGQLLDLTTLLGLGPSWSWKPLRMEMAQPPWAVHSSAWPTSWWKRFSLHQGWIIKFVSPLLLVLLTSSSWSISIPYRYWQTTIGSPWNLLFSMLHMPRKILIVRFSFISFQFSELEMATSSKENAEIKKIKKIKQVCSLQRSSHDLTYVDFSALNFMR